MMILMVDHRSRFPEALLNCNTERLWGANVGAQLI